MRRFVAFWAWKTRRTMATRLRPATEPLVAPERLGPPEPTATEWREAYEWYVDLQRRAANGSLRELPSVREQLAGEFERLGL